jgi:hypothetical protein
MEDLDISFANIDYSDLQFEQDESASYQETAKVQK